MENKGWGALLTVQEAAGCGPRQFKAYLWFALFTFQVEHT
jgi:hypothetical protein